MTRSPDHTICDLCNSDDITRLSHRDRHGKHLDTGICKRCGLVFHTPLPTEDEVAEYYASHYRKDYHGERTPSRRRVMRAWKNGDRIYRQVQKFLPQQASVFEIGAGIGCTVKQFEQHGHHASGIEPNHDFNRFTREEIHAQVENTNLFDLQPEKRHDLVLLIHVIEHFVSPTRALSKIAELIADGGLLYIECPNVAGPFATFDRMFHYAHIYNFAPQTLQQMAAKCGFELVASFTDENHPDLRMLFRKSAPSAPAIGASQSEVIRQAILRHNTISYHLRPAYLARRAAKLMSYAWELIAAPFFVPSLLGRLKP